jgi:hypothetical protein
MSLKSIIRCLFAIGCMGALPLYAQTTDTTDTSMKMPMPKVEQQAKPEVKATKTVEKKEVKTEEKAETKTTHHMMHAGAMSGGSRLLNDSNRLAVVLADTQAKANVSDAVWKTVANEANTLADRVHASAKSSSTRKAAASARTHVREMRAAAMKGDAAGARMHAAEALPFVYQIIDAAAPRT